MMKKKFVIFIVCKEEVLMVCDSLFLKKKIFYIVFFIGVDEFKV